MRRLVPLLSVLGLGLAGCRAQPYVNAHLETLNAEYRQLEDYVYALEEENARLNAELQTLRARSSGTDSARPPRGPFRSRPNAPPSGNSPRSGPTGDGAVEGLEPPHIEIPNSPAASPPSQGSSPAQLQSLPTSPPEGSANVESHGAGASYGNRTGVATQSENQAEDSPEDTPPRTSFPPLALAAAASMPANQQAASGPEPAHGRHSIPRGTSPATARVSAARGSDPPAHLVLDPQHSRGADWDGRPGDDGLQLLVQAFSKDGEEAHLAGKLAIVVLDPSRQGEAARLARWDFDAAATAQLVAASPPSVHGLKLELPWPGDPPTSSRLTVFVRLEMEGGQRLETHRDVFIIPPGQQMSGWTPRARRDDAASGARGGNVTAASHQQEFGRSEQPASTGREFGDAGTRNQVTRPEIPIWSPTR
jgi:hypothetical protein